VTITHDSLPLNTGSLDETLAQLRRRGMRVSAARRLVLEALFAADGPVSAEQIADGIGGRVPRSDVTSVYRNLETLQRLGVVRHMHLGHNAGRYRLADGVERSHVACERCGAFAAVGGGVVDEVRAAIEQATGYEAHFTHFPIVGLCPACAARSRDAIGGFHAAAL
jgi:Fur family transcriptional regulator, ferric uptake regulator